MTEDTTLQIPIPSHNGEIKIDREERWTNIQIDSQVLSIFMACPRKYEYIFLRKFQSIGGVSSSITRGLICHDAALVYWKEIIATGDYSVATQKAMKVASDKLALETTKFDNEGRLDVLRGFLEFLGHVRSSSWIPLDAEKYFKKLVYEDAALRLRIFLTGRIDVIFRAPGIPVIPVDMKTESERWFYSAMSNQFKIYCIACGVNLLGVQRVGFQKTLKPEDKFKMETLAFDADILDEFQNVTLPYYVKQLLLFHEEKFFPMNTTSCVHGHFKCQFSDGNDHKGICNVSRSIREQKLARYFVIGEAWDPSKVAEV